MNCSNCGAGMGQHETPWPSAAGYRCHVCGPEPVRKFAKALWGTLPLLIVLAVAWLLMEVCR